MAEIKTLQFVEGLTVAAPSLTTWEVATPTGSNVQEVVNIDYLSDLGIAGLNNISATTDPTVSDDSADGYTVGSRWVNVTLDKHWIALDVTPGAAIWKLTIDADSTQTLTNKTIGDDIEILGTTESTDKDTGALVVDGGVGVEKNLNVGGNVVITGDLTVNGTSTTINTATLNVEDANITVNDGGNQLSADGIAGITVEMSDATDTAIVYDSTLASRFKCGDVASEAQIVTVSHTQTLTNKTIDADANTITNIDNADIKVGAAITRSKLANGTAYRIVANDASGVIAENAAITANRAVISDANGQLLHATTTATEIGYVNGVTSAIQTQLNGKLNDVFTTNGDLLYENSGEQRLPIGTGGQVLTVAGGLPTWATPGAVTIFDVFTVSSSTTMVSGRTYLANTSGGAFNLTLPSPAASAFVRIKDRNGTFRQFNLTVVRSGSENIEQVAANYVLDSDFGSWTFVSDGTNWWIF